jgi:mono/diheme cytochrome c family protein
MAAHGFCAERKMGRVAGRLVLVTLFLLLMTQRQSPGFADAPTSGTIVQGPSTPEASDKGANRSRAVGLYQEKCLKCHGADGKGEKARETMPDIPDFTARAWQEQHTDAQLKISIEDGKGDDMPAFGGKLSPEQIQNLVAHIRAFRPASPASRKTGSGDLDERFRELQKELEALRRQFKRSLSQPSKQ